MSKAGRIALGFEWKKRILENKAGAKWIIPNQIDLTHPYILEAEESIKPEMPPKEPISHHKKGEY